MMTPAEALAPYLDAPPMRVTVRQAEVLDLLLIGLTESDIGKRLGVSGHTVHSYLAAIREENDNVDLSPGHPCSTRQQNSRLLAVRWALERYRAVLSRA